MIINQRHPKKGGVICDIFAKQREAWANVNWFLAK